MQQKTIPVDKCKVDCDGEPHDGANCNVGDHVHLISTIVPSGKDHDDGEDGGEEVEDSKEEDAVGPLKASSDNAQQT